jgi:hypothetical protein
MLEQASKEKKKPAGGAEEQAVTDRSAWTARIGHASGAWAAGKRGNVLEADKKPCDGGIDA